MYEEISLEAYKRAYREMIKEEEKRSFKIHLVVYVLINIMFIVINFIYSPWTIWFFYPLLGWGIGIISHYLSAIKWIDKGLKKKEAEAEYMVKESKKG